MKFLKNRVLPFVCVFSILISLCIVPAFAVTFPDAYRDTGSVDDISVEFNNSHSDAGMHVIASLLQMPDDPYENIFWRYVNQHLDGKCGEVTVDALNDYERLFDSFFNMPAGYTFPEQAENQWEEILNYTFCFLFFGEIGLEFEVAAHPSSGLHRIYCPKLDWWVTDSAGKYPYCVPNLDTSGGNQWIGEVTALDRVAAGNFKLEQSEGHLDAVLKQIQATGKAAQIRKLGSNHKCIWFNRQVLCNDIGQPIVCWYSDDKTAVNQERDPTTITTEDGDIVLGDKAELDLENMLMYLPNGSINFIDNFTYDESTKSYHIDSHDTYNYTVNNYYTWNYYINYTSITYIGQTEEYNKYYEVYYELPDGRDSADLTKEELEQLNLSIDVIPYGRSADDTSLRSLYHFDGDTRDSSYWNYCTDFTWNTGASLTYMDAGVFDGALYLDETEHDFTFTLPSNIGSNDFTLQFRYYQSHTEAPQTDSYVKIGDSTLMQFSGGAFLNASGSVLADTPVGTWNEVALVRANGTVYYYLNGVCIGSTGLTGALSNTVNFHFGSSQQTFKYFDELRVLHHAVVSNGGNYEPTSVPHDTNLTLVLPDSKVPVADEYWSIKNDNQTNLLARYGLDSFASMENSTNSRFTFSSPSFSIADKSIDSFNPFDAVVFGNSSNGSLANCHFPYFSRYGTYTSLRFLEDGFHLDSTSFPEQLDLSHIMMEYPNYFFSFANTGASVVPASGLFSVLAYHSKDTNSSAYNLPSGEYAFSLVTSSGAVETVSFSIPDPVYDGVMYYPSNYQEMYDATEIFSSTVDGYVFGMMCSYVTTSVNSVAYPVYWLFVRPESRTAPAAGIVYMELVEGTETDLSAEWVESVTLLDKDDLNTPTLAVRTDIDITSYQIGGVRPSLPTKGQVWALVENERIVSIQIYNGQAWEGVDGRIWTGSRWIPASSYNIVTLQDMYDIVDATPDFEYIYTESGFWSWWQKSWNAFTEKLFSLLGTGGTGGGSGATGGSGSNGLKDVDLDKDAASSDPDQEDSKSLWQFIVLVIDGGKSVVKGVRHLFSGVVSTIPDTMDGITGAFDSGGVAVGLMDGTGSDPDVSVETYSSAEGEVLDPWRYR